MAERQFYVYKFNSNVLDAHDYKISLTFRQARDNDQIVALADSQMLRSIRDICGRYIDNKKIEELFNRRDELIKLTESKESVMMAKEINKQITQAMFVPEYVSLVIDKNSHYKKVIKKGVYINGEKYKRFSCSASQARVNTVILIKESIYEELETVLNNGRKNVPLNPSKFNAYFGLNSSATKTVRTPRAVVVKDCVKKRPTYVNWVDIIPEEDLKDDILTEKWVDFEYNYFDGMGLITPHQAQAWAEDLELDYIPAEFCIRHSFIKGMVCVFDVYDFCEKENNGNYMITDIYGKEVDIRDFDIILTESQFKLWNCYDDFQQYEQFCLQNKLTWGISQFTPKQDKRILTMNYQSLQTLDLDDKDLEELCKYTLDTFSKVSGKDIVYSILYMLGENISEKYINDFLENSDNYWLKSLLLDNSLIKDKFIQQKVYENIINKIKNAGLGEIYVNGNYQVLVSDPYALMEHICGKEVIGLLGNKEHYSNYWLQKGVVEVDGMRSPLTYYSEHNILNFKTNDKIKYWYKHLYTGIVLNVHGDDVIRFADSDFDYDIVATTDNPQILKGVLRDTLPVAYGKSTTKKQILTFDNLCEADMMAFGSDIGKITNRSTSMYAMLPLFEKGSEEYKEIQKRLILTRVQQGNAIDKAKGIVAKPFPKHWTSFTRINEDDSDEVKSRKELFNKIIIDKKPYFFKNRYSSEKREYSKYKDGRNRYCTAMFGCSVDELRKVETKTEEEVAFLEAYDKFMPLLETDCVMNRVCKIVEQFSKDNKYDFKAQYDDEVYKKYLHGYELDSTKYSKVKNRILSYLKEMEELMATKYSYDKEQKIDYSLYRSMMYDDLKEDLLKIVNNSIILSDYVVTLFYTDLKGRNKSLLWEMFGKYIFMNVKRTVSSFKVPVLDEGGDIEYLGYKFRLEDIVIGK